LEAETKRGTLWLLCALCKGELIHEFSKANTCSWVTIADSESDVEWVNIQIDTQTSVNISNQMSGDI